MAILKLIPRPISEDCEFLPSNGQANQDNPDFIEFRKQFYHYQYEFIIRSQNKKPIPDQELFFKNMAKNLCDTNLYGTSQSSDTYMKRYDINLTVDFKLSIREAHKLFSESSNELWKQIESMYKEYNLENIFYITDIPKNATGVKSVKNDLFERWENAIKIFDEYEKQPKKNKAAISREMGWFENQEPHHATEKITLYLRYANRLIEAACRGELLEEASKPMTAGKKRK